MRGVAVWAGRCRRAIVVAFICTSSVGAMDAAAQAGSERQLASGPRFLMARPESSGRHAGQWQDASRLAVFQRRIALDLRGAPLGQALREVGRKAGLQVTYSPNVLQVEAPVQLSAPDITVGAAFSALLYDAGVDILLTPSGQAAIVKRVDAAVQAGAIVGRVADGKTQTALAGATVVVQGTSRSATTGNDGRYRVADVAPGAYTVRARYIGYAPGSASVTVSADEATADFGLEKSAQRLDEVVTTGTLVPTEVKALPTPITVITADDIEQKGYQRVDQIFRGDVPGAVAWDQGPGADYYSTVSVRGVSTLTAVPGIKTFIDGVEVADPTLIATIDPKSVERIEVTRGPQASTLYGAGALSGVMQVFTKKGELGLTRPQVTGKFSVGAISGFGGQSSSAQTDNTVSMLGGGVNTSYSVGGSYRHTGDWVPSYHSTDWGIFAGGRTTQGPLTLSGSARYADKRFDYPFDPRFAVYPSLSKPYYLHYQDYQQTYGLTGTLQATRAWQHTLTVGYDQTYYSDDQTQPRFTTPADSFLLVNAYHIAKTSFLYHTDLSFRFGRAASASVTAGVNYVAYDYVDSRTAGATRTTGSLDGLTFVQRTPWTNIGYFSQLQISLADQLFITAGLRAERNANLGADFGTAWSPRIGAAYAIGFGPATVKLRASYGESIRAPFPGERDAQQYPQYGYQYLANPNLAPERQRGAEGGVDVYFGRGSLGATYYNQRAIDLIDATLVPTPVGTLASYQFRNISRVKNEGWEFEGRVPLGPVQLAGTYSITNSTVQQLPPDYPLGGYQVGDRILGVPYTSAGVTATFAPTSRTTLTASMTRIGHWIETDWMKLFGFYYGGQPYLGSSRAYWIDYPAVTKFAVGINQVLTSGLAAFVRAENVGNTLRSERNNLTIPTPRSVTVGANVRY